MHFSRAGASGTRRLLGFPPRPVVATLCLVAALFAAWWAAPSGVLLALFLMALAAIANELAGLQSGEFARASLRAPFLAAVATASGAAPTILLHAALTVAGRDRPKHRLEAFGPSVSASGNTTSPAPVRRETLEFWLLGACAGAAAASLGVLEWVAVGPRDTIAAAAFVGIYLGLVLLASHGWRLIRTERLPGRLRSLFAGDFAFAALSLATAAAAGLSVSRAPVAGLLICLAPAMALAIVALGKREQYDHYFGTMAALTLMLQRAHPYTRGHLERVGHLAEEAAIRLGLSPERSRLVHEAAVLHDIGKIAVDERILDKPGPLTPEERSVVQKHAAYGSEILRRVEAFREHAGWILRHHERPDGQGYPDGLRDEQIPVESKIIAVADAFDAMTHMPEEGAGRSYRQPVSVDEALAELARCSGSQFDPDVVRAFREALVGGAA